MGLSRLEKDIQMLLSVVLDDVDKKQEYIICVMAKVDSYRSRRLASKGDVPIMYGYVRERIPTYLMKWGIMTNIPREGHELKLISGSDLAKAEEVINSIDSWDLTRKLEYVAKYLNKGTCIDYPTAQPYLVYRSKAEKFMDSLENRQLSKETPSEIKVTNLPEVIKEDGANFDFGEGKMIRFENITQNEYKLFKYLIDKREVVSFGDLNAKFGESIGDINRDMVRLMKRVEHQGKGWMEIKKKKGNTKVKGSASYRVEYFPN